jgi:hypothetical protein
MSTIVSLQKQHLECLKNTELLVLTVELTEHDFVRFAQVGQILSAICIDAG